MSKEMMYNTDSLQQSILHHRATIANMRSIIKGEQKLIEEEEKMIEVIKEKKRLAEGKNIEIIRE